MPALVGIDEAGYGPLLGPLTIGASVWTVQEPTAHTPLWNALRDCVCRRGGRGEWRLVVNDSKKVYHPAGGLGTLERTVLAFAAALGLPCDSADGLLGALGADPAEASARIPWYGRLALRLPLCGPRSTSTGIAQRLRDGMQARGAMCVGLLARLVPEDRYNARLHATRNKAAVLLEAVLDLIDRCLRRTHEPQVHVCVDRLGGRADYRGALMQAFPERELHVVEVSAGSSRYVLTHGASQWTIDFRVDADRRELPVALASMVAKYVRELVMTRFNAYWRGLLPQVRPTAGYQGDARRFLRDIQAALPHSGLRVEHFVRAR